MRVDRVCTLPGQATTPDAPVGTIPRRARLLLVKAPRLAGETLQVALAGRGYDTALSASGSADEILGAAQAHRPRVVILDLERAGPGPGLELVRPMIDLGASVLVLTGATDRLELARCLEAGAAGVAGNEESFASLVETIARAVGGQVVTPINDRCRYLIELDDFRRVVKQQMAPFEALTPREREVLERILDGRPAAEIARRSYVSLPTIRTHIRSILQKLEVNSQKEAAAMARQLGWPSMSEYEAAGQAMAVQ